MNEELKAILGDLHKVTPEIWAQAVNYYKIHVMVDFLELLLFLVVCLYFLPKAIAHAKLPKNDYADFPREIPLVVLVFFSLMFTYLAADQIPKIVNPSGALTVRILGENK